MKKFLKKITLLLTILLCLPLVGACNATDEEIQLKSFLGSPVTIVFSTSQSGLARQSLISKLNSTLSEIENELSVEKSGSDIYNFNQIDIGEVEVSENTYNLFNFCEEIYESTDGAFNIANYMLVDLWGFTSRHNKKAYSPTFAYDRVRNEDNSFNLPDQKYIDAFKKLADFSSIKSKADGEKYYLIKNCKPQYIGEEKYVQKIDMSGIAKGFALDKCQKIIDKSGLTGTYISFGGSSLYLSDNDGEAYELGIVNPFDKFRKTFAVTHVRGQFVSTSGVYENNYTLNGKLYHHIIDAASGKPAENELMSVTIIGLDGKYGDAYSTAATVMGKDKAIEFLSNKNCTYVIVDKDKNVYTNSFDLEVYNLEFTLIDD